MKVTLIANISANGKVLLAENPDHQVPQEAIAIFMQVAARAGNLVLGKKTFDLFQQFPGGAKGLFPNVEVVLLSSEEIVAKDHRVVASPEEAIRYLTDQGYTEIAIGGGVSTYNSFLERDLVTELYLNISPILTGDGGVLGTGRELNTRFTLAGHRLLADGIIQLHLIRA